MSHQTLFYRRCLKRNAVQALLFLAVFFVVLAIPVAAEPLLSDNFNSPDGLITNEYAYWNPSDPGSVKSSIWEMDSGSFFANGGAGWTGVPDNISPNARSSNGTNSSVFRLKTKRSDFGDVSVSFSLLNQGLSSTPTTPPVDWDGLQIWLRYQAEDHLYYASINRRDNSVVIKKKIPGGPSNGGTYYNLSSYVSHTVPYNTWHQVHASVKNNVDGSVTIKLYDGDTLLVSATDNGTIGGSPIVAPGKVGMRGDNANLKFDDFAVSSIGVPSAPTGVTAVPGDSQVTNSWNPVAGATSYNLYRSRYPGVNKSNGYKIGNVSSPHVNKGFTNGTTYYMVVTAVNESGESSESAEVWAVPKQSIPGAPTGVVATPGDTQVTIGWNSVAGATSYNLYRSRTEGVNKTNGYKITNVVSPYLNKGFTNGTTYYMVVTALNASGESPDSIEVSAVPYAGGLKNLASSPPVTEQNINSLRVYPNPWRSDRHSGSPISFDQLDPNTTVKIFTVAGQWVATLPMGMSRETWNLMDDSGEQVASGLYIYLVIDETGQKKRGTVAVIR